MLNCVEPMDIVGPAWTGYLRRFIDIMDVGSFDFLWNDRQSLTATTIKRKKVHKSTYSSHTGISVLGFVVVTYCCPANEISMNELGLPRRPGMSQPISDLTTIKCVRIGTLNGNWLYRANGIRVVYHGQILACFERAEDWYTGNILIES